MVNKHVETDECGFDRTGSHSTGHYVCTCGWEDSGHVVRVYDPREDKSPPSKERVTWIVSMMWDLGMYTQAREVQRLGDAYEAMKVTKG